MRVTFLVSADQTKRLDFGGGVGMSAARGGRRLSLGLVEERVELIGKEAMNQVRKIISDQET